MEEHSTPEPPETPENGAEHGASEDGTGESATGTPRRLFLRYTIATMGSFIGVVAGLPVVGYVASPLSTKPKDGTWVPLGRVEDFNGLSDPQLVQFTLTQQDGWNEVKLARTCWVVPQGGGSFTVFNGQCTHLGCAYTWQAQGENAGTFRCPCHDGAYTRDGQVLGGPPPRSLDTLQTKVENGQLSVLYEDFHLGTPTKVAI